jgi:formylglycine-generating enzyme required for sulfatase activity
MACRLAGIAVGAVMALHGSGCHWLLPYNEAPAEDDATSPHLEAGLDAPAADALAELGPPDGPSDARQDAPPDALGDANPDLAPDLPPDLSPDAAKTDGSAQDSLPALADQRADHGGVVNPNVPGVWMPIFCGTFTMGSPATEPCRSTDETEHRVTLTRPFEMQTTEVTQQQFKSVMGYLPAPYGCPSCPVEHVDWHQAAAYCNALSNLAGRAGCYDCATSGNLMCAEKAIYRGPSGTIYSCPGYRLPTEAEWECAYRAGTTMPYYSGPMPQAPCSAPCTQVTTAGQIGWYCANSQSKTHPVQDKSANGWGLYDMAGNVWEWCHDAYDPSLGTTAVTDPVGQSTPGTPDGVLRGGAFNSSGEDLRAAARLGSPRSDPRPDTGFRCARSL